MFKNIMKYYYELEELPITSDSLESIIHACDKWIINKYGLKANIIASRYAKWRNQPLSEQQIKWLKKKGVSLNDKELNRGQASNLMTKIIEGAGKNWKLKQKQKNRIEKKEERERKRKETYKVKVGPLK